MNDSTKRDREKFEKIVSVRRKSSFPKRPTHALNHNTRKYCEYYYFTYEIFYIVSEISIFIFDIWKPVSDFEIFFDCDEEIWGIVLISSSTKNQNFSSYPDTVHKQKYQFQRIQRNSFHTGYHRWRAVQDLQ